MPLLRPNPIWCDFEFLAKTCEPPHMRKALHHAYESPVSVTMMITTEYQTSINHQTSINRQPSININHQKTSWTNVCYLFLYSYLRAGTRSHSLNTCNGHINNTHIQAFADTCKMYPTKLNGIICYRLLDAFGLHPLRLDQQHMVQNGSNYHPM